MNKAAKKKPLAKQNQALPKKPELTILKQSDEEIENFDVTKTDYQLNIDAIAGLAFIENVKSGQTKDQWNGKGWNKNNEDTDTSSSKTKTHLKLVKEPYPVEAEGNNLKVFIYLIIIASSLFGTFKLLNSSGNNNSKVVKQKTEGETNTNSIKTKTITPKRIQKTTNTGKIRKRSRPSKRSVRRAPAATSFRESEVFKKHQIRKLEDSPLQNEDEEDNYNDDYDDGREPLENDPIRKDTSKEIINPEDDYYSNDEKDYYDQEDGAREPSSNEETWVDAASEKEGFEQVDIEDGYQEDFQEEYPEENIDELPFEDAEQF